MNTLTISKEDFKKIHSAYCEMVAVKQRLEGVMHKDITKRMDDACEQILEVIDPILTAMDAEEESDRKRASAVGEQLKVNSIWSTDVPESFDDVAFKGVTLLRYRDTTMRISSPIKWSALWIAADLLIGAERDNHIFIEGFEISEDGSYIKLLTGS